MTSVHGLLKEQNDMLRRIADRVSALETYLGLAPTDIERLLSNDSLHDKFPAAPPPQVQAGAVEVPPPSANATTGSRTSAGRPEDPAPRCGESASLGIQCRYCLQPTMHTGDVCYRCGQNPNRCSRCAGLCDSPSGICDACWTQGKDPPAPIGTRIEPGRRVAVLMRAGDVRGAKYLELEHDGRHRVKLDKAGIMSVEDGALQVLPVTWASE